MALLATFPPSILPGAGIGYDAANGPDVGRSASIATRPGVTSHDAEMRLFGPVRAADRRGLATGVHGAGGHRRGGGGARRVIGRSRRHRGTRSPRTSSGGRRPCSSRRRRGSTIPARMPTPGCTWAGSARATSRSAPTGSSPPGSSSTRCATVRFPSTSSSAPARPRGCCKRAAGPTGPGSSRSR